MQHYWLLLVYVHNTVYVVINNFITVQSYLVHSYNCSGLQCGLPWEGGDLHMHCQTKRYFRLDCWAIPTSQCSYPVSDHYRPIGSSLDCSSVSTVNCADLDFVATLTNLTNPTTVAGGTVADMTSTLAFTATLRLNGTVVQCRGTTADGFLTANRVLSVAGALMLQYCVMLPIFSKWNIGINFHGEKL